MRPHNCVDSRLPTQISTTRLHRSIYKNRSLVVRSSQAKEERSVRLQPPQQKTLTANKTLNLPFFKSTTSSTPFLPQSNPSNPLVWQRISQNDAVVLLSAASIVFSYLASDLVFFHNLVWLDTGVHLFIRDQVSPELHTFARYTMSNSPIVLGWCGWAASAAALLYKNTETNNDDTSESSVLTTTAWRHLSISSALYLIGGGTILHGDPWLVKVIKDIFQRTRPTELSHTYAFPSGHTTSAVFVIGALLFVILPAVMYTYENQKLSSGDDTLKSIRSLLVELVRENRILIWILCAATTASGRVIADVHWSTDVMAGGCLGVALVALTALACEISDAVVVRRDEKRE